MNTVVELPSSVQALGLRWRLIRIWKVSKYLSNVILTTYSYLAYLPTYFTVCIFVIASESDSGL